MKKLFSLLVVALLCGVATAQNVEDIRIYINPGHGSWGPNNRHMATLGGHETINSADPDTTDFYESNTNLWKCLEMFHRLKDYGFKHEGENALDLSQNLVMSRIENGPYPYEGVWVNGDSISPDQNNGYNRRLTEIAAEVEANNFDMFISVHSNALTEGATTNYPIFLYRGYDDKREVAGVTTEIQTTSANIAKVLWPHLYSIEHMCWTATSIYNATKPNIRGDINFMGSSSESSLGYLGYYGVLKHGVPGFIVEGYFHTYQPARHRAMNYQVCQIEGLEYAHGIAEYYGVSATEKTGHIYGVIRDLDEKFSADLYNPVAGSNDVYKPLNGVTVTLKQGDAQIATCTTDGNYNGAFVFRDLEPGTYQLEYSHADYLAPDADQPTTIEVKASSVSYPKVFLRSVNYVPPKITYVNYPDSTAGRSEYFLLPSYDMTATTSAIAELEGKTIRRTIVRDGYAYILAHDASKAPSVYVYDIAGKAVVKTLGTTAAVGDIYTLSDIALTADGYLVGINKANQAFGGANNMKAYKWENDEAGLPDGEVAIWWEINFAGNWSNAIGGEACYYNGTLADGEFVYTGTTTASTGNTRLIFATISDGAYVGKMRNNQDGTYLTTANYLGETYSMTLSPLGDDRFVLNSDKAEVVEMQKNVADVGVPTVMGVMNSDALAKASANESYFKYAGRSLMVAPDVNADGMVQGIKLFDITDGLANAVEVATNCTIDPVAYTFASAHGELKLTLTTDDLFSDADIVLYLNVDGQITKWTEKVVSAAKPSTGGTANPFAYALASEYAEQTLSVGYSLNAAAADVNILIKNEAGEVVETVNQGALAAGDYTAEISVANYNEGNYTWAVEVAGEEKAGVEMFQDLAFYHPGGLAVDNSMESPSFGTLFVAAGYSDTKSNGSRSDGVAYVDAEANSSGLYIYDPVGTSILNPDGGKRFYGSNLTFDKSLNSSNTGDMIRVGLSGDGRIFVGRGSDSGDYILYAESLDKLKETGTFTSLVTGLTFGSYVYSDASSNFVAGPVQALSVTGSGENTKLIAIMRASNDNASYVFGYNRTVEYALGNATILPTPTPVSALDQQYTIGFNKATNVKYDNEGGIWYCQYRGTPSDAQPALIYVDANGAIKFFEGEGGKSRRSAGLAVSPDGKRIAANSAAGQTTVYDVYKSADGTVVLKDAYIITTGGNNMYDLAWDAAGNLYGANASTEYVRGYAIPRTEPAVTTAATKYAFVVGPGAGVEDLEADESDAPVVYYNLQGVQVDGENLTPGIYVKVQGSKSEKILVR